MAKSKFKRKGKAKFLLFDGYLIRSEAWKATTPHERSAYLELKWRYDGLNNGRIGLGCRELADALKSSKDTALRTLDGLIAKGFIVKAKPSGFNMKNRTATEWRLTEYPCDVSNAAATKDFMRWHSKEKQQAHQKDSGDRSTGQKTPHRRTTGTVSTPLPEPQAHQKDTYSITTGGYASAAV